MDIQTESYIRELTREIEMLRSENEFLKEKLNAISQIINDCDSDSKQVIQEEEILQAEEIKTEEANEITEDSLSLGFDSLKEEIDSLKNLLKEC